MDIRAFDVSRLPRLSRKSLDLLSFFENCPPRSVRDRWLSVIGPFLSRELESPLSFHCHGASVVSLKDQVKSFSKEGVYMIFSYPPIAGKIVVEADPFLVHAAIDKILGGKGEAPAMIRPLTDIEEGVFSFIIVKILSELARLSEPDIPLSMRLEQISASVDPVDQWVADLPRDELAVLVSYRVTLGNQKGSLRLILPSSSLQAWFKDVESKEDEEFPLSRFGFIQTDLWAEVGRASLKWNEIQGLEPGDVVLLQKTAVRLRSGKLEGVLSLHIGQGNRGGRAALRGRLLDGKKDLQLVLEGTDWAGGI